MNNFDRSGSTVHFFLPDNQFQTYVLLCKVSVTLEKNICMHIWSKVEGEPACLKTFFFSLNKLISSIFPQKYYKTFTGEFFYSNRNLCFAVAEFRSLSSFMLN